MIGIQSQFFFTEFIVIFSMLLIILIVGLRDTKMKNLIYRYLVNLLKMCSKQGSKFHLRKKVWVFKESDNIDQDVKENLS